jgi:hypothetical protein
LKVYFCLKFHVITQEKKSGSWKTKGTCWFLWCQNRGQLKHSWNFLLKNSVHISIMHDVIRFTTQWVFQYFFVYGSISIKYVSFILHVSRGTQVFVTQREMIPIGSLSVATFVIFLAIFFHKLLFTDFLYRPSWWYSFTLHGQIIEMVLFCSYINNI